MPKYSVADILAHYRSEAQRHADQGTSTIQDLRTRALEMKAIFSYIRDGMHVLEIGCGNGFVAQKLIERFAVTLDAFDFSPELIAVAKARRIDQQARGTMHFFQADVLAMNECDKYDLIFTERTLQNLVDWPAQQRALINIVAALKPSGLFVMEECFWSGLNNLNAARKELDIEPILESWHNVFFHDDQVVAYMHETGAELLHENCFLSGYYFGSRVLLPALYPKGKKVASSSVLNDFFCAMPPAGNFCPMKIMLFKRNEVTLRAAFPA